MSFDYLSDPEETKEYSPRFRLMYIVISATAVIFLVRLWQLQILQGAQLREFSEKNRVKEEKLVAPRGMILDRESRILVDNEPGFEGTITPQYAKNLISTAEALGQILDMPPQVIVRRVQASRTQNGPFRPVRIRENLSRNEVARIERVRFDNPGLEVRVSIKRSYRLKDNGAQLFGYVGEISKDELPRYNRDRDADHKFQQGDVIGKSGLEQRYDEDIRGADGLSFVQVDAHGREINTSSSTILKVFDQIQESIPGANLHLTIDKDIQEAAYEALNKSDRIGGVVALNPNTGEVLAWVNAPSFDPAEFSGGISPKVWASLTSDPFKPLRNKVIQDHTPPGSTFKAIVGLAGLSEGVIKESTTHHCPGFLAFGRRRYHCHLKQGHGSVNVVSALEKSCDVFFYKVGLALGIDNIAKYARALGIGIKTDVAMNNEQAGLMPTSEWKLKMFKEEWQAGENLSNAIGQGFVLSTPLQMAVAFSGLAAGGPMYRPFLVKRVVDLNGATAESFDPVKIRDIVTGENTNGVKVTKENLELIREGLRKVVNGDAGTARGVHIPGIEIAGKTGTVQLFSISADQIYSKCYNRPKPQRHHGWFVGFAPFEKPEIVVAVLAEHSCSGSKGAGPVAHDIFQAYFKKYHPEQMKDVKEVKLAQVPLAGPPAVAKPVKKPGQAPASRTTDVNTDIEE